MKNYLLHVALFLSAATAHSQAVSWELSAQPGDQVSNSASFESTNFINCNLTRGSGITASTGAGSMNASGWFSGSSTTTLADAIAGNDYYEIVFNTTNCLFFNPTTIKIVLRSSATGPNTATLRCSSDGFATNLGTVTVTTTSAVFSFSESLSPNSLTITYRLYGYGAAAGGGTPSAGGTMRIGSSVVATDNDLELFSSTTPISVTQVANMTFGSGASVPATAFAANVPGAVINWSRTPEAIGLGATSGTGNVPAFTASTPGASTTSTFTVNATVGNCTSPAMIFTITVDPPPCTITVSFLGNPGACDDNGTPNDPSDDFFTQNIQAIFLNRPVTGNLQIVPGGDQIGTYSIPVSQTIGNSHVFTAVKLKADGTPTVVQMNFTDSPGCINSGTGPTVQPCSTAGPCSISSVTLQNVGPCNDNGTSDPTDDYFTADVRVTYSNPPATGNLEIELPGDVVPGGGATAVPVTGLTSPHTFTGVRFKADGTTTVVEMQFSTDQSCVRTASGPAVQPCSVPCSISSVTLQNIGSCNENGTSNPADDYFTADVRVVFVSPPATGNLEIELPGDVVPGGGATAVPVAGLTSPHTFTGVRFKADGTATIVEMQFSADQSCVRTASGPAVQPCSSTPPVLTCPGAVAVSCASQAPAVNPASVSETHDCPGSVSIIHLSDVNSNVVCINRLTVTRTYQATDQCGHIATCSQTITINDQTPPTVTCPPNVQVSCANLVPAVDVSSIGVTDNCVGGIGISRSFVGDVTSNQACTNRFTLTRTYRGGDACGNTATCTQVITVNDQTAPTLTCPAAQTVACANQVPAQNISLVTGLGDNCGGTPPTVTFVNDVISNQTCANRFTLTRTYRATDACSNSATCSQIITVNDQTGPSMTCPAGQTVSCAENLPASDIALVTGVSDNCGGTAPTVVFVNDAISNQSCSNRLTVTRTYRATDACGNSSSCTQVITVNDQTQPVFTFVPANTTVDCYLVPGVGIATATDNCTSGATVSFIGAVKTPGICPVLYTLTRSWRASDACGNSSTASQQITVTDLYPPQFLVLPQNRVVECGPDNAAEFQSFLDNRGDAVVEDCTPISYSYADSPIQNNSYSCGNTFHRNIRFFATDVCGNVSFRDASFTVVDQTPPVFSTAPKNVALECELTDDNGQSAFYDWLDSNAGLVAEDACGTVTLEKALVGETHGCGNTWQKTYEFRAKDQCGNLAKTTATFAVVDNTPPTLSCPPNDNMILPCLEDVPAADPASLTASDCSGVKVSLTDTWTNGTGCPGWMKTVAYRYTATDGCGNAAVCERAYYVRETDKPTLVCPDTVKVICVNDIPGPQQVFTFIKNQLVGNCAGGFSSITILSDSGEPQNGAKHRTYSFTAKNHCGAITQACTVTFFATGACNQICTASQSSWGDPNGTIGNINTADVIPQLIQQFGQPSAGGGNHTVSAPDAACVQTLLFGSGDVGFLPTGHFSCPLPASLSNPDGSLNNELAANTMALQLNIWYNLKFNSRNLGMQNINNLPPCLVEFALLKDLGQYTTVQDLLDLSNLYLQGVVGYFPESLAAMLNSALDNLNFFRVDCQLNSPCERPEGPVKNRNEGNLNQRTMRVFPNPTGDVVTIEFWSGTAGAYEIGISGMSGLQNTIPVSAVKGLNSVSVQLNTLPAGIYWMSLQNDRMVETRRLVKVEE